ncbi:hypothetical protein Z043_110704 [Scleropages formosus]|uniref:Adhesion G-protein coupled receptor G2 n=1 Tax=Scleropages formosus TaxID=113540 RepID=A0A0P7VBF2_SCLFO|nr:hypothetical protein Z043_110704 [Scleropages formosus]
MTRFRTRGQRLDPSQGFLETDRTGRAPHGSHMPHRERVSSGARNGARSATPRAAPRMVSFPGQDLKSKGHNLLQSKVFLCLSILLCHEAIVTEAAYLGGMKAVFPNDCGDHWTLREQGTLAKLAKMTVCVDVRVLFPGTWIAFSYRSPHSPQSELTLQGDGRILLVMLGWQRYRFYVPLALNQWHRVCLSLNAPKSFLTLRVNNVNYWQSIGTAVSPTSSSGELRLGCQRPSESVAKVELYLLRVWDNVLRHSNCEDGNVVGWNSEQWEYHASTVMEDSTLPCAAFYWMDLEVNVTGVQNESDITVEAIKVMCDTKENISLTRCSVLLQLSNAVSTCRLVQVLKTTAGNIQTNLLGSVQSVAQGHCPNSMTSPPAGDIVMCDTPTLVSSPCQYSGLVNVTCNSYAETVYVPLMTNTPGNVTCPSPSSSGTTVSVEEELAGLLASTSDVLALNSSEVEMLVSKLQQLLSGPNVSLAVGNTTIAIVSNLLNASASVLAASSTRLIEVVDTVGLKLVLTNGIQTIQSPSLALAVKKMNGTNFQQTSFTILDPNNIQVSGEAKLGRSVLPQASITLPASLTSNLTPEEQLQASRVQFNFYQKSTLFVDPSLGNRTLNSGILGSSVSNLTISGLKDNVVFTLRNNEPIPANFVASCVFWDFSRNGGQGGWNSAGCFIQNSTDEETICSCNHLTSFGVLLDISMQGITDPTQILILTYITYIGCGISAIFLSVTLLTYLAFEKLRKDIPSKILINLCLALLLLNLVFLLDSWLALYSHAVGLCISTAFFLHYFLLASFTWMGLEAFHMYLALVKVFNTYVPRYMLKFGLVGWGVPLIVVIIVIAINKDNYGLMSYGRFPDGSTDDFCWIKNNVAFYVAVVAYFCLIFLLNMAMFVVVLVQLCRIKRQNPHNTQHRNVWQEMRSVAGLTFLLGLTWGFAFFAWGPVNLAFMYLFCIFNCLQGFFIFVFHCAVKDVVRRQWRTYLCCGKLWLPENSGNPVEDAVITAMEQPSEDVVLNEINSRHRHQREH